MQSRIWKTESKIESMWKGNERKSNRIVIYTRAIRSVTRRPAELCCSMSDAESVGASTDSDFTAKAVPKESSAARGAMTEKSIYAKDTLRLEDLLDRDPSKPHINKAFNRLFHKGILRRANESC